MPLVLAKKKPTLYLNKPTFETTTPTEIVELMEEIGAEQEQAEHRHTEMKRLASLQKPYNDKVKRLAELVTDYGLQRGYEPDAEFTENSEGYVLNVGKQAKERRVVDVAKALKFMGKKVFFEKVNVPLGIADQYMTPEEKAECISVDRTERTLVLSRRQGLADAAE